MHFSVIGIHFMVIKIHFTVIQMHFLVIEMYFFSHSDALFSPSKYNLWEKPVSKLTGESASTYKTDQKGFLE